MTTWLSALDVPGLIFVCVITALLVLVVLQGRTIARQGALIWFLVKHGQRTDPRYYHEHGQPLGLDVVYPDLDPEPPVPECAGPHPVAADGRTCSVCGIVLVP